MPEQILPEKAVQQIEGIIARLMGAFDYLNTDVQAQINELYLRMRDEYAAALFDYARASAVARFLGAIAELPFVQELVGEQIEATKGRVMRGGAASSDPALLEHLPPRLDAPRHAAAPPAMPQPFAPTPTTRSDDQLDAALPPTTRSDDQLDAVAPAPSTLARYPDLEYPPEVVVNQRTSLCVALLIEQVDQSDAAFGTLTIEDTADGALLPQLEIVVRARGFDIEGSNTQLLDVARDEDSDVRFVLIPRSLGPQSIRVDFYQQGRRIGTVRKQTNIVQQPSGEAVAAPSDGVETLELTSAAVIAPDLELCVETDPSDNRLLYFSLHSTTESIDYHHARMGSVRLQGPPLERMQHVYSELSKLAADRAALPDDSTYQRNRLASIGRALWDELFSDQLKAAYWEFRGKIKTLLITSDEPWIPWEMVKPYRYDANNARLDEPFLCEQFNVARWLSGPGPADRVPVSNVRPVAPLTVNLPSVQAELGYLQNIEQLRAGLFADPPYNDRNRVIDLWENGSFSVLHFAAHGAFDAQMPDNSGIGLTGGPLRPSDLFGRFGGPRSRPLVFINACHGARAEYAFTGLGGWADRLVRQSRVGAFIGAAWEVNDRLALLFAETFYKALLHDGKPLGESFRIARATIRDADSANSTWLAYVLYADPGACALVAR